MNGGLISKQSLYVEGFSLSYNDKTFKFHPIRYNGYSDTVGILFDISEECTDGDKLAMMLRKEENGPLTIILEKKSCANQCQEILEVIIEDKSNIILDDFSENLNFSEYTTFKKSKLSPSSGIFQVNQFDVKNIERQRCDGYSISTKIRFTEVIFQIKEDNSFVYTLIVNPEVRIQKAMHTLFNNWYVRYGLFLDGYIIDTSSRFVDCGHGSPISISIAEKCHLKCSAGTHPSVILPWTEDCLELATLLSNVLNIDSFGIRFFDEQGEPLREEVPLNIKNFRSGDSCSFFMDTVNGTDTSDPLGFSYKISSTSVRCSSAEDKENGIEFVIPEECSVLELKKRLHRKLGYDPRSLLLLQREVMLTNETKVSDTDPVVFFVASIVEGGRLVRVENTNGRIYLYKPSSSTETIVLKQFDISPTEGSVFIKEYLIIKTLTHEKPHPNIVRYLGLYIDGVNIYIGMEHAEGGSLGSYLSRHETLNEEEIGVFSFHILQGLKHLHDNKINHRDIKGPNILLVDNDIPKLCDFGLSKMLSDYNTSQLSSGVTQTGECGTLRWMAPEVIRGEKYAMKADIWSFGATVVEMITGQVPYHKLDPNPAYFKIGTEKKIEFESPNEMSAELKEFVDSCLRAEPGDRPRVDKLLDSDFIKLHSQSLGK